MSLETECASAAALLKKGAAELHTAVGLVLGKYQKLTDRGNMYKPLAAEGLAAIAKLLAIMEQVEEPIEVFEYQASTAPYAFESLRNQFKDAEGKLKAAQAELDKIKADTAAAKAARAAQPPPPPDSWDKMVRDRENFSEMWLRTLGMMGVGIVGKPYGTIDLLRRFLKEAKQDAGHRELYRLAKEADKHWRAAREAMNNAYRERDLQNLRDVVREMVHGRVPADDSNLKIERKQ